MSKQFQSSDFGGKLSEAQIKYCANDVIYLHKIHDELNKILVREDRSIPEGVIFIPFCYNEAAANLLTNPALDPYGKIPEFKYCAAKIETL